MLDQCSMREKKNVTISDWADIGVKATAGNGKWGCAWGGGLGCFKVDGCVFLSFVVSKIFGSVQGEKGERQDGVRESVRRTRVCDGT